MASSSSCTSSGRHAVFDGQGAAHEHGGAVADEAGDDSVGQVRAAHVLERGVDAVAQVARRVDQRSIQIEDESLSDSTGMGRKYPEHGIKCTAAKDIATRTRCKISRIEFAAGFVQISPSRQSGTENSAPELISLARAHPELGGIEASFEARI